MATSVKLYGDTYNYTISNIQNSISCTPSNRNSRYGAVYSKPTVTINTKHACTRYIYYKAELSNGYSYLLATYKVVFSSSSTTGTVTEVSTTTPAPLGHIAKIELIDGNYGSSHTITAGFEVTIATSESGDPFDWGYVNAVISSSGWNPSAPTITHPMKQDTTGDPDPSIFGYIAGYAQTNWTASGGTSWTYGPINGYSGTIAPKQTLTLSANGASSTSPQGTGTRSVALGYKLQNATSVTGTAKLTNTLGGSTTATQTATVQAYSIPIAKSLAIGRVTVNNEKHASMSIGWSVNELNKQSTASQSITSGAIACTWECVDLANAGVIFSSGEFDIVSNGDAMTVLTDTTTETLVDTSGNGNDEYDPDKSFRFTAYITDRIGRNSLTVYAVLASEFYLICAKEGGRGIGFGMVPEEGRFKVSNALRPWISGVMAQGTATWNAAVEDAPYGRNNVGFGIGADGNTKGIWCSDYNGVDGHWMIKEGADGEAILNKFFPVGSVVITYTNSSPASRFGGSWSLFDKEYKYTWVSSGFTFNTTNTTEGSFVALCTGKAVEIRLTWKNKIAISDDTRAIGTMNMSNIGMSAVHTSYGVTWNDALGGIGMVRFAWSDGVLTVYVDDWATRSASYPTGTGQWCYLSAVIMAQGTSMTDSFCDKFYWRRTA